MKNLFFFAAASSLLFLASCKEGAEADTEIKATADSLYKEVMNGHDVGMAKMMKLGKARDAANRMMDSISKLPAQAREAALPLQARLETLVKDLNEADSGMNAWMTNFKYDSAKNDLETRVRYLGEEKLRVTKVKEAILGSLAAADSVLQSNF